MMELRGADLSLHHDPTNPTVHVEGHRGGRIRSALNRPRSRHPVPTPAMPLSGLSGPRDEGGLLPAPRAIACAGRPVVPQAVRQRRSLAGKYGGVARYLRTAPNREVRVIGGGCLAA